MNAIFLFSKYVAIKSLPKVVFSMKLIEICYKILIKFIEL